jgi:hypothetical protein
MAKVKIVGISSGQDGTVIQGARLSVYDAGTSSLSTIYSDQSGTSKANPFLADGNGLFQFFADPGLYDVKVTHRRRPSYTHTDLAVDAIPYNSRPIAFVGSAITVLPASASLDDHLFWNTGSSHVGASFGADDGVTIKVDMVRASTAASASTMYEFTYGDWFEPVQLPSAWEQAAMGFSYTGPGTRTFQFKITASPVPFTLDGTAPPSPHENEWFICPYVYDTEDLENGTLTFSHKGDNRYYGPFTSNWESSSPADLTQFINAGLIELSPGQSVVPVVGCWNTTNGTKLYIGNFQFLLEP